MSNDNGACFIFTGGAPRSGTTLLQNMLDSHPDIFGGPEFLHIPDIMSLRNRFKTSIDKKYIELYCTQNEVDEEIRHLIERFLLPVYESNSVRYLSEKTPGNILVFCELAEMFPKARLLGVIRDPRATVASLLQVGKRARKKGTGAAEFAKNAKAASRYVLQCTEAGLHAAERYPEQVLTIKYEDLVKKSASELRRICNFLDIEFMETMLYPAQKEHSGEAAITERSGGVWYDRKTYCQNPHTKSLEKWKETLSPSDELTIYETFRNYEPLQRIGYTHNADDLGLLKHLRAHAENLRKKFFRVF